MSDEPIHFPHRSAANGGGDIPITPYPGPILDSWRAFAARKGFDILRRVIDKHHLELGCHACGALMVHKIFNLRTAKNLGCEGCRLDELAATASRAGLTFLRRDSHRHYGIYRTSCGHEVRRQFELIRRAAAGIVGVRCDTCHADMEAAEAEARGWTLLGPDPDGNANYRLYGHSCGNAQRIARANMQTGRFGCSACDEGWFSEPSRLYLLRLDLEELGTVLKLGYSRDPVSRMRYQLGLDPTRRCELIRDVAMSTGHEAVRIEKALHARLRGEIPDLVVPVEALAGRIRVVSEIYQAEAEPHIRAILDELEEDAAA